MLDHILGNRLFRAGAILLLLLQSLFALYAVQKLPLPSPQLQAGGLEIGLVAYNVFNTAIFSVIFWCLLTTKALPNLKKIPFIILLVGLIPKYAYYFNIEPQAIAISSSFLLSQLAIFLTSFIVFLFLEIFYLGANAERSND